MLPMRLYNPADYGKAERKELDRPSTLLDVAEFVTDYLSSDVSGHPYTLSYLSKANVSSSHLRRLASLRPTGLLSLIRAQRASWTLLVNM